jgi:histidinol-phosphate/aromatic aminotransferase/cobyric acid decarboxylase-like protein
MSEAGVTSPAHGGLLDDELEALGLDAEQVLDLSVNVNPYGPSPLVRRALAAVRVERYPDPRGAAARRAWAAHAGVPVERVALGNGAVDLLWTLARAALHPGDRVLVVEPAFSEMRAAAARAGAEVAVHRTLPECDFALDVAALDAAVRALAPKLVYACTPQNPSGVCTPLAALEDVARRHPGSLFVVDLSFLSLSERHFELGEPREERVVWLRSLTKDHALAGLRVGVAVAPPQVVAALDEQRPPWSVNALAQAALVATTTDGATRFVQECRTRLLSDRAALVRDLRAEGLRVHPSQTIYVLADLGPRVAATELRARLLARHRVLVRDGATFGLPHHVRIAARAATERERFLLALRQELRR